jgi:hypothetical protein
MEGVPGVGDAGGMDHDRVCDLGSGEAVREEGGGMEMEYSMGWMGFEKLGRKTRVQAITVSAR